MKFLSILYQSSYVSSLFHFSSFKVASFSVASERRNRRSNIMDAGGGELNLNHILGTSVVNLLGMDTGDFQYDRLTEEPSGQPTEHVTEKKKGGNQKKKVRTAYWCSEVPWYSTNFKYSYLDRIWIMCGRTETRKGHGHTLQKNQDRNYLSRETCYRQNCEIL